MLSCCVTHTTYAHTHTHCVERNSISCLAPNVHSICIVASHNSSFSFYCYYFSITFVCFANILSNLHFARLVQKQKQKIRKIALWWYMNPALHISICVRARNLIQQWIYLPNKEIFHRSVSTCFTKTCYRATFARKHPFLFIYLFAPLIQIQMRCSFFF